MGDEADEAGAFDGSATGPGFLKSDSDGED